MEIFRCDFVKYTSVIFVILFLFSCNQVSRNPSQEKSTEKVNDQTPPLEWHLTGLPPDERDIIHQELASKFGFKFVYVAGCIVSDSLATAVANHNAITDSILKRKHGVNWIEKLEAGTDSVYKARGKK